MTQQEIFDKALSGIRRQGVKAESGEFCVYYDYETGNKCAAGQLLDDKTAEAVAETDMGKWFYLDDMHTEDVQAIKEIGIPDYLTTPDNISLIQDIQYCHDFAPGGYNPNFMDGFEMGMKELAESYGLVYTAPQPLESNR